MTNTAIPHYDVIIIGAGSVGTPSAFFLAQAGYKVLVVDKAPSIGQSSNKRAIGGIRATHSDPAKIRLSLRSIEIFSTWKERYGDDIEWSEGGYVFVARTDREEKILKDLLVTQKSYSVANRLPLARLSCWNWYPTSTRAAHRGNLFAERRECVAAAGCTFVFRPCRGVRCVFKFNEKVSEIILRGGKVAGVKTDQGEYGADVVVNAAGPWAREIAQLAGLDVPVKPDSHEAAITEAVAPFLKPMIVDISPGPGSSNYYFYQHLTGQIIFCITPSPSIWGFDVEETSSFLPMVSKRMVDLLPRLKNIRVRRTWRGLYPMTPDGMPIIGNAREIDGLIQAVGMCGQGFMLGPGVGELVSRLVSGKMLESDAETLEILSPYRQFAGQEMLK